MLFLYPIPFIDDYLWSDHSKLAGLRLKAIKDGKEILIEGGKPIVTDAVQGKLHISWPLTSVKGTIEMELDEKELKIKMTGDKAVQWFLDLTTAGKGKLPFVDVKSNAVDCVFETMKYSVKATQGSFSNLGGDVVFRISPRANTITLRFH